MHAVHHVQIIEMNHRTSSRSGDKKPHFSQLCTTHDSNGEAIKDSIMRLVPRDMNALAQTLTNGRVECLYLLACAIGFEGRITKRDEIKAVIFARPC